MNRISENQPSLLDAANGVTMENDTQARLNVHGEPTRNPIEDLPVAYVEFNAQGTII
jgi:hypothetical protein